MTPRAVVHIPERFQGPTGQGQGGWSASRLAAHMPGLATVRLAAPVPLDRDLHVLDTAGGVDLVDPETGRTLMEARPWTPDVPATSPVTLADAAAARARCPFANESHPVPLCFSCGLHPLSMRTHAGPLGDGRVATDWRPPAWAADAGGGVDPGVIWGALDCTSGFYVALDGAEPIVFTAQYAVDIVRPLEPGRAYALVGWSGEAPAAWARRKRCAAAAAFDDEGRLVAYARSLWIAAR